MKPRSSDSVARGHATVARAAGSEHGIVIVLFAFVLIVLLLGAGLAVDLGIAHVTMGRLSRAVDAGALTGAKHATGGPAAIKDIAKQVANANFAKSSGGTASYDVQVDQPATDTYRVRVTGDTTSPALFSRMMGRAGVDVTTLAEATRYPLDLSLVLDVSGSLRSAGVFDDLQVASKKFITNFDDQIDQVGLVAYTTWAWEPMRPRKNFKAIGSAAIDALVSLSYTNIDEGLRLGKAQLDTAPRRDEAFKVVVLFTDGRPTAFADNFRMDGPNADCAADTFPVVPPPIDSDRDGIPDCYNGVVTGDQTGSNYQGLYTRNNGTQINRFLLGAPVFGSPSPRPLRLPGGAAVNAAGVRTIGARQAEDWANAIRSAGYTVYSIGLGNPRATNVLDQPDLDFLKRIANEDGVVNAGQPQGELMFAPSAAELDEAFARLADRILTRLTK